VWRSADLILVLFYKPGRGTVWAENVPVRSIVAIPDHAHRIGEAERPANGGRPANGDNILQFIRRARQSFGQNRRQLDYVMCSIERIQLWKKTAE
jgi:hypothetical protein